MEQEQRGPDQLSRGHVASGVIASSILTPKCISVLAVNMTRVDTETITWSLEHVRCVRRAHLRCANRSYDFLQIFFRPIYRLLTKHPRDAPDCDPSLPNSYVPFRLLNRTFRFYVPAVDSYDAVEHIEIDSRADQVEHSGQIVAMYKSVNE